MSEQVYETQVYLAGGAIDPQQPVRRPRRSSRAGRAAAFAGYEGAKHKRPNLGWNPGFGSADEDLLNDLPALRERSRDLYRNNPLGASAIDTMVDNVVGSGFYPQSRVDGELLGWSEQRVEDWQRRTEDGFRRWSRYADAGGRLAFEEMTRLICRQVLDNGEIFQQRRYLEEPRRPYGLAWDCIEADRVDTPYGRKTEPAVRAGIVFDENGGPQAYYINKKHPGDMTVGGYQRTSEWIKIPRADGDGRPNILHIYEMLRPGQSRGVPLLTPVITAIKQLCDYLEAEVVAAHVNACFAAAITMDSPEEFAARRQDTDLNSGRSSANPPIESLEPGAVYYLNAGESVEAINATRPNSNSSGFVEMFCRLIGAAVGLPFELLLKNFSKTNYSSARAALLEARRKFKRMQLWLVRTWCQPVWELLVEEMVLRNELAIPLAEFTARRELLCRAFWLTPRWGWVDPTNEVEAMLLAVQGDIDTLANVAGENGADWVEVLQQRAREKKMKQKLGLAEESAPVARRPGPDGGGQTDTDSTEEPGDE